MAPSVEGRAVTARAGMPGRNPARRGHGCWRRWRCGEYHGCSPVRALLGGDQFEAGGAGGCITSMTPKQPGGFSAKRRSSAARAAAMHAPSCRGPRKVLAAPGVRWCGGDSKRQWQEGCCVPIVVELGVLEVSPSAEALIGRSLLTASVPAKRSFAAGWPCRVLTLWLVVRLALPLP
jgi:hypothetical protein